METAKQRIIRWMLIIVSIVAFFWGLKGYKEEINRRMGHPPEHEPACRIDQFPCCNFPDWCSQDWWEY